MTSTTAWEKLEQRLNQVKKPVRTFKLCDDADIRDRYLAAQRDADQTDAYLKALDKDADPDDRAAMEKQAKAAAAELADAKKAYDAHTIVLRFTALERQELEDIQKKHPASEDDEAQGNDYAFDTFGPALISAASLDGMTVEAASRFLNTWTAGDAQGLWQAAWSIQHTKRTDLGKG
jgi:hypothetical protein